MTIHPILVLLLSLLAPALLLAQQESTSRTQSLLESESTQTHTYDIFTLGFEIFPSPGSGSFFTGYQRLFGTANSLEPFASPHFTCRFELTDALRLYAHGGYQSTGFDDLYDAYTLPRGAMSPDSLVPAAQISERFDVTGMPALAGIQFSPVPSQFTSYVGAAGGVYIGNVSWKTTTRAFDGGFSRPETNVDDSFVSLAARIFAGVDLRFDELVWGPSLFRGIYVEASYFYLPIGRQFFQGILNNSRGLPLLPDDEAATMNAGGFSIVLGLTIHVDRTDSDIEDPAGERE